MNRRNKLVQNGTKNCTVEHGKDNAAKKERTTYRIWGEHTEYNIMKKNFVN